MTKVVAGLIIGLIAGIFLAYQFGFDRSPETVTVVEPEKRDLENVPEVSLTTTEELRNNRYESIGTIEEILALPTDFAETEALYVIAGRSTANELVELIQQADRIVEKTDRNAATTILLSRLTALDPTKALATARSLGTRNGLVFENTVWTTWGRLDLEQAALEARDVATPQKNTIAQILYASVRDGDASKMNIIQSALGIKPSMGVLMKQLYALADRSPEDAVGFIESQDLSAQRNLTMMLAHYQSQKEQGFAAGVVMPGFASTGSTAVFEQTMGIMQAQANPKQALETYLSNPGNQKNQILLQTSLQNLMSTDPDQALAYLDEIPSRSNKTKIARSLITKLASTDPERALEWVRENRLSNNSGLVSQIITTMATADPQGAFKEAQAIKNRNTRSQVIGSLMQVAARLNPEDAVAMLDQISNFSERRMAITQLSSQWVSTDFDQALEWVATLDAKDQKLALQGMQQSVAQSNVDNAIRLLERFPEIDSRNLKYQIVTSLVTNQSVADAQAFIEQYRGTPEYSRMQQMIISTASYSDPDQALQMISSMPDGQQKDQLYLSIVSQKAADDPEAALQMMESMTSQDQRQQATQMIAMNWHNQDPDAAEAWLQRLPQGAERDGAIVAVSSSMARNGDDAIALIQSMSDPEKRSQALMRTVQMQLYQDPEGARELMSGLDLSDADRAQLEQMMAAMEAALQQQGEYGAYYGMNDVIID